MVANLLVHTNSMTMVHLALSLSPATSSLWSIYYILHLLSTTIAVVTAFYTPHYYQHKNIMSSSLPTQLRTSTTSSTNNEMVQTEELLSTIIHAATYGSHTISSLSDEARNGHIQFKEEGDARSALTGKMFFFCLFVHVLCSYISCA